jgi:hypothetical protein
MRVMLNCTLHMLSDEEISRIGRAYHNWRIDEDDEEEDIYGDEADLLEYEYGKAKRG